MSGSEALAEGLIRSCLDLATISVLAAGLFLRRHRRQDLMAVYVAFNVGLFAVLTFLSNSQLSAGVGFGVFGVLSIIRLRSEAYNNVEIAYFFLSLATGLVNALPGRPLGLSAALDVAIVLTMYFVDSPSLHDGSSTSLVVLDRVYDGAGALRLDLETRLSAEVLHTKVVEVDYLRESTKVEVRHRPAAPAVQRVGQR